MINELSNWDDYTDPESEEERGPYNSYLNETTKKLLLRKYTLLVKESLTEGELMDIMAESKYQDDEIKKKIEERLVEKGKNQFWKGKTKLEYKQPKSGVNKKYPINPSLNVPPQMIQNPSIFGAFPNFANFGHFNPFVKNLSVNSVTNLTSKNYRNLDLSAKDTQDHTTSENSSVSYSKIPSLNIKSNVEKNEIDEFFDAALDVNKLPEREEITTNFAINTNKNSLSSDEIKKFIEDLKKNKEIIQKSKEKMTYAKMELSLKASQKEIKSRDTSPEMKLDYDTTKIPSFLNAYSYSNYFFQNNSNGKEEKYEEDRLGVNEYQSLLKSVNQGQSSNLSEGPSSQQSNNTMPSFNFNYNMRMQMPFSMHQSNLGNVSSMSNILMDPTGGRNMMVANSAVSNNNISSSHVKPVITSNYLPQNKITGHKIPMPIYPAYYNNMMMRNMQNIQNIQNIQNFQNYQNLQNFANSHNIKNTSGKNSTPNNNSMKEAESESKNSSEVIQPGLNINKVHDNFPKAAYPTMTPYFYQSNPYFYPQFPYQAMQRKDLPGFNSIPGLSNPDIKSKKDL